MVLQWTGNVILALLNGGIAAAAQRALLGSSAQIKQDLDQIGEDVEKLLESSQGPWETDRVILK